MRGRIGWQPPLFRRHSRITALSPASAAPATSSSRPPSGGISRGIWCGAVAILAAAAAYPALNAWLASKAYLSDPVTIADITRSALGCCGGDIDATFANITRTLSARYPGRISADEPFIFMRAGGWMGSFKLCVPAAARTVAAA